MCNYHHRHQFKEQGACRRSPRVRFYRSLRAYVIFHMVMMALSLLSGHLVNIWPVTVFWGLALAIQYVKFFGWPGTQGWFGRDWEDWINERERREQGPEPLDPRQDTSWKGKDLV